MFSPLSRSLSSLYPLSRSLYLFLPPSLPLSLSSVSHAHSHFSLLSLSISRSLSPLFSLSLPSSITVVEYSMHCPMQSFMEQKYSSVLIYIKSFLLIETRQKFCTDLN